MARTERRAHRAIPLRFMSCALPTPRPSVRSQGAGYRTRAVAQISEMLPQLQALLIAAAGATSKKAVA